MTRRHARLAEAARAALRRLRKAHEEEYRQYLHEEKVRRGLISGGIEGQRDMFREE